MCGCDGQGIVPVVVQGPSSSYTVLYASAPSSGKIGPCTGISSTGNSDASPDTGPAGTCLLEYNDALAVGDPCCYRAGSANTCNKNVQCNSQSGADCCLIYATDSTSYGERCCLYANGGQVDGAAECAQLLAAK
jgi:hypothetical protein